MKKIMSMLILCVACSSASFSANIVDVYGAKKGHAEAILKKYAKKVAAIESELSNADINSVINEKEDLRKIELLRAKKNLLTDNIKKEGSFLFVYIHTTTYPGEQNQYTTIEVIENNQPIRLRFVSPEISQNDHKPSRDRPDLINEMVDYDALVSDLIITNQLNSMDDECPVYHCTVGFGHPKMA